MVLSSPKFSNCNGTSLGSNPSELEALCEKYSAKIARLNKTVTENPQIDYWLEKMRPQFGATLYQNESNQYNFLESKPKAKVSRTYFRLFDDAINATETIDKIDQCGVNSTFNYFLHTENDNETDRNLNIVTNVICVRESESPNTTCGDNMYQCQDGTCISIDRHCDGIPGDCFDSSDEMSCDLTSRDRLRHFVCNDNTSIPYSRVCDFIQDCQSGEDEQCSFPKCTSNQFQCANYQCIPQSEKCNFVKNCRDGSDEVPELCDNTCVELPCTPKSTCQGFTCFSGKCIPKNHEGDLIVDCGLSEEDERIDLTEIVRGNFIFVTRPIPKMTLQAMKPISNNASYCEKPTEARCHEIHPHCFDRSQVCIYDHDLYGNLKGCRDGVHLRNCSAYPCEGMFRCPDSYCLPLRKVCDGVRDCPGADSPDENSQLCGNYSCSGGFRCKGTNSCLSKSEVCNGIIDCPVSHDDERLCEIPSCPLGCQCNGFEIICMKLNLIQIPTIDKRMRAMNFAQNNLKLDENTFKDFIWLIYLNLTENNITNTSEAGQKYFDDLYNLEILDLSYNKIEALLSYTFQNLNRLKRLILTGNPITVIEGRAFTGLFSVTRLNLAKLKLNEIEPYACSDLTSLSYLNLSSNKIPTLPNKAINNLPNLTILDIRNNEIGLLEPTAFENLNIKVLYTDAFRFCCAANITLPGVKCTPEHDEFSSCFDLMANSYLQIAIWVLGIMALVGNLGVLIYRLTHDRQLVTSFLITNLSISDLLMGIYLLIIACADTYYRGRYVVYDEQWRQGALCKLAGTLNLLSSEMSVVILLIMSADRVIAISFPFRVRRLDMKSAKIILGIAWLLVIIVTMIPFIDQGYFSNFYGRNSPCLPFNINMNKRDNGWAFSFAIVIFNFISFILIMISYIVIYIQVKRAQTALKGSRSGIRSSEMAFLSKISLIVATNFCCWVPVLILELLSLRGMVLAPEVSAWIAVFVLPVNASVNPYLYTLSALKSNRTGSVSAAHTRSDVYSVSKQERVYYK